MEIAGVKIYIADTKELEDMSLFQRLYPQVSSERKKKIDGLRYDRDKRLSLAAGLLLKYALSEVGIEDSHVIYIENKKPYVKGVQFNLSHSGERVMCVVSAKEVGCDVEKITNMNLKIAKRFFTKEEFRTICQKESPEEQNDTFFRFWTLKESFMKVTGLGMKLSLNDFQINLKTDAITVCQNVNRENYYFKEYDLQDGYKYAVCSLVPDFQEVQIVTLSEYF